jgi:hypothetical protein
MVRQFWRNALIDTVLAVNSNFVDIKEGKVPEQGIFQTFDGDYFLFKYKPSRKVFYDISEVRHIEFNEELLFHTFNCNALFPSVEEVPLDGILHMWSYVQVGFDYFMFNQSFFE